MDAVDNADRIADALTALIEGLEPVVTETLTAAAPDLTDWTELLAHKDRAQGRHGLRYSQRDVSLMLRAMTERLGNLGYPFERVLGRRGSNYASELREVRNRWAHHDEFTSAETYRALDSAELLLRLVGADEQAAQVAASKVDVLPVNSPPVPADEFQRPAPAVADNPTFTSDETAPEDTAEGTADGSEAMSRAEQNNSPDYDDIVVRISHISLLSYAMAHNRLQVVGEVRVENDGVEQRGASVEVSVITAHGDLGDPKIFLVDLGAGATTVLRDVDLLLDPARMLAVDEQMPAVIRVAIRGSDGAVLVQKDEPVSVLPANHWRSGDGDLSYELLPAFVQPNALVIASLLTEASTRLEAATGRSALDGYQSESEERVDAIVRAICEAMIARDIRYAEPPAGWQRGQKVRTPAEVLEGRLGTCLDTTVTLAAALEQAGIHSTLWLVPGHIFLGYWRRERVSLDVPVETSPEFAINAVDLNLMKLIETTKLTGGASAPPFETVLDAPRGWLSKPDNIDAIVDVALARQRVLPLPSRSIAPDGTVTVTIYQPVEQDAAAYESTGGGKHRELETVPPRVAQWKNALLDLSLRNRLINYTPSAGYSISVPGRSIARLEDMINGGTPVNLLPSDQVSAVEAARGIRYARDLDEQTRDAFLAEKKTVHIDVTGAAYTSKLRYLANKAKTVVEETGANNLYLAFGMLRWRTGDRDLRSPLVLVPVTLETHSRGTAYRLKLDEAGSSTPNYCLLEKLRLQFGIPIPGLANPAEDDAGIDLAAAFEATRLAILQAGLPFLVEETVDLAILQFSKFRLWKDLDENWAAFAGNSLVKHLIETPLEPFVDPVAARAEVDLDQLGALSPVPADSSQLDAVAEAVGDRTFVLEGPPGTGKSQTITNLLARALAEGKRVLFVAEKRAALEVVKKRLEAVGLGRLSLDLHDKGARPTAVRQQIKQALELRVASDPAGFAAAFRASATARGSLDRYARQLHDENAAGFSMYSARGEELAGDQAITPLEMPESFVATADFDRIDALRDVLAALPETADLARPRPDHPWGFLDEADGRTLDADAVHAAAAEYDSALDAVLRAGIQVATVDRAGAAGLTRFAQVAGAPRYPLAALDALGGADWRAYLTTLRERLIAAQKNPPIVLQEVRPEALHLDVQNLDTQAQAADESGFFGRKKRRRAVIAQFGHTLVGGPESLPPKRVSEVTAGLVAAATASAELKAAIDTVPLPLIDAGWRAWDPGALDAVLARLTWVEWLTDALRANESDPIIGDIRAHYSGTPMGTASPELDRLARATADLHRAADLGSSALLTSWAGERFTERWHDTATTRQLAAGRTTLDRWLAFLRATAPLRTAGLDVAWRGLLDGSTRADIAVLAFDRGLAVASITERRDHASLTEFDVDAHNTTIERFTDTAATLRSALPTVIPAGVLERRSFDAMSSGGQIGGLRRQLDRQRGGMSVRALMENFGDVITQIAPCTLISPESVARFFPARAGLFDIVVFDEASQIRVADAVGAMGRGRSVVVVGDSKQMPPTSFAEAGVGGDDDAADTIGAVQDEESILTECVQAQVPSKWLSWHYRSQDESLISFSNHHYYDDRLSSFPAPIVGGADHTAHGHGISLIRVDGHFERSGKGKTLRTNRVEADAIVADVLRRFAESPDESPSVGVVTFNSQQRDLIENLLRDSDEPRAAIALDEPDGLFVKNLENVQGDERDAILFSIAFSANERGVVPLNFGPLTRAGGERRLNVAITRARRQVVLYSSFDPSELRTHETASTGLKHLRAYLELAQRGVEAEAAGLARQAYVDRHREEVADELRLRGFAVSTDVGLSDFRVDISVAKADAPNTPLVAVLLDGSQWRGRRTVADRDGLPVEVLGNLMRWPAVERVWLPEWLRDRERVLDRLSAAVDEASRPAPRPSAPAASHVGRADTAGPAAPIDASCPSETAGIARPLSAMPGMSDVSERVLASAPLQAAPLSPQRRHASIEDFSPWRPVAHGSVSVLDDLPRSAAERRVQAVVADVMRAEAPISRSRLAKLVAGAFGLERVAQARANAILRCVPPQHILSGDREFLWPEGATPATWLTVRVSPDNPMRPVDAISLEELANGLRVAADQLAGGSESELKRTALALFGIKRLTAQVDERMSAALRLAIESGRLDRGSGGLLVSGRPNGPTLPPPGGGASSPLGSYRASAPVDADRPPVGGERAAGAGSGQAIPPSGSGFAVIDFETTGLFSNGHDRIVEVAVVHVDRNGTITGSWETLVNPSRDIGATRIHGITAASVLSAPTFAQIAPRLVELLSGRVIVAHNAKFDTAFLLAELNRLQYAPDLQLSGLCTMQLAREFLPGARRRLSDCCAAFDIEIDGAHRASADALATAKLLGAYMGLSDDLSYWHGLIDAAAEIGWPPMAVVEADWVAREVAEAEPPTFLERMALRMPDHSGPDEHREYLELLDRALLDRRISLHEREALVTLATDLGIGRDKALELHSVYFDDLVAIAWEDGILTQDELADIVLVGGLLGIDADRITASTALDSQQRERAIPERPAELPSALRLLPGDQVVLTGEMSRVREEWIADLTARGLVVWPGVTKKVRLVVAADPDSLSGKARKARDYGIPIVDEAGLVALLGR